MLLLPLIILVLWIVFIWLLGKQYYRGRKPLRLALLVTTCFLLSLWIIKSLVGHGWFENPWLRSLIGFLLSSCLLYWALRGGCSCCGCDHLSCGSCSCASCDTTTTKTKTTKTTTAPLHAANMSWGAKKSSGSLVKDDLKRIEWIGPAIEKLLHAGGIMTFGDLASSAVETIQEILTAAGKRFQVHNPKTRPEQASLAAKGERKKLEKMQDILKWGK